MKAYLFMLVSLAAFGWAFSETMQAFDAGVQTIRSATR